MKLFMVLTLLCGRRRILDAPSLFLSPGPERVLNGVRLPLHILPLNLADMVGDVGG